MDDSQQPFFDFKLDPSLVTDFAADYLRQYYHPDRPVTEDEQAVYCFIRQMAPRLSGLKRAIEVGCGPTAHHALMLAPLVGRIDFADYLEGNLSHVRSWLAAERGAWSWRAYTNYCLKEDGIVPSEESARQREGLARERAGELLSINLLARPPLQAGFEPYDLVAAFYCTEEIALTSDAWCEVMQNLRTLLKPGGYLLMACLSDTDFYHIAPADGGVKALPCLRVTQALLEKGLPLAGFASEDLVLQQMQTQSQTSEGVSGIWLCLARAE